MKNEMLIWAVLWIQRVLLRRWDRLVRITAFHGLPAFITCGMMEKTACRHRLPGKKRMIKGGGTLLVLLAIFWTQAAEVQAHKVYVFAWVEQGQVHTESRFGDQPVHGGKIVVKDLNDGVVLQGKTDDQGNFSFPVPRDVSTDLTVYLDAAMGHQATWGIPLAELRTQGETADARLDDAMEKKAELAAKPSPFAVAGGIAVIFMLCFLASVLHKKRQKTGAEKGGA